MALLLTQTPSSPFPLSQDFSSARPRGAASLRLGPPWPAILALYLVIVASLPALTALIVLGAK